MARASPAFGLPELLLDLGRFVSSEGVLLIDDTYKDGMLNTVKEGLRLPMSSVPGERVGHTYAGPMAGETIHFVGAVAFDRPVLATPEQVRQGWRCTWRPTFRPSAISRSRCRSTAIWRRSSGGLTRHLPGRRHGRTRRLAPQPAWRLD